MNFMFWKTIFMALKEKEGFDHNPTNEPVVTKTSKTNLRYIIAKKHRSNFFQKNLLTFLS